MNKVSFKQVRMFNISVGTFYARNPDGKRTKLGYAIDKVANGEINKILKDYNAAKDSLYSKMVWQKQVDLALTDPVTKAVLEAPKGSDRPFLFDKEGLKQTVDNEKAFEKAVITMFEDYDKKEFDIDPHYVTDLPHDLTLDEIDNFRGFVIAPNGLVGLIGDAVVNNSVQSNASVQSKVVKK